MLTPAAGPWRVISTHTHACNLLSAQDDLLALVSPQHGNGPFQIVVPLEALACIQGDEIAQVVDDTLVFLHKSISLTQATAWNPTLPPLTYLSDFRATTRSLHESNWLSRSLAPLFDYAPAQVARAQRGLEQVITGVQTGNLERSAEGAQILAGLGPGLTPAGDDLLLGLMAGLTLFGDQRGLGQPWWELRRTLGQTAAQRTTRLSAAWLRYAAQGEFGEPWHDLREALQEGQRAAIDQALQRILHIGATSGQAALLGFIQAVGL